MRIIIEIDDRESTTITIQSTGAATITSRAADEKVAASRSIPPPEVLAAAAALGALNAGPAPLGDTSLSAAMLDPSRNDLSLGKATDAGHAPADLIAASVSANSILASDNSVIEVNDAGSAPKFDLEHNP
jgi:hypothetical protein